MYSVVWENRTQVNNFAQLLPFFRGLRYNAFMTRSVCYIGHLLLLCFCYINYHLVEEC